MLEVGCVAGRRQFPNDFQPWVNMFAVVISKPASDDGGAQVFLTLIRLRGL